MMDPVTATGYLQLEYQAGFRFSLGSLAPDIGPDVRQIDLLPIAARGRTASQARVWVSESTREVFKTGTSVEVRGPRADDDNDVRPGSRPDDPNAFGDA